MRGILFIEPLYNQTIKGVKTQTRRSSGLEVVNENPDGWRLNETKLIYVADIAKEVKTGKPADIYWVFRDNDNFSKHCKPRYKVGEVLYIKEPYTWVGKLIKYKFDLSPENTDRLIKWENKLFMKSEHGRAFIRITGIKCERLMDISDEDCIAEGIEQIGEWTSLPIYKNYLLGNTKEKQVHYKLDGIKGFWNDAKLSFLSLYKFANKVKEVPNLWVWCYSFEYLPDYKLS